MIIRPEAFASVPHPLNTSFSTFVLEGRLISFNFEHLAKASLHIFFKESGSFIVSIDSHPLNASSPISVTPSGITTVLIFFLLSSFLIPCFQIENASFAIDVTDALLPWQVFLHLLHLLYNL